jgi:RpiR family transcriptional regulator, carbohydrate utilization regulator
MLSRIETIRSSLRKSERRVADLVLANPNSAVSLPIGAVADQAGISQPTVARFCRAIGCTGFKDFKLRLAQSLASGVPYVHSDVRSEDPMPMAQ